MKRSKIAAGFGLVFAALALAGCGAGPSEGEIEKLVHADVESTAAQMKAMGAGAMAKSFLPTVHGVKKIGCEKNGSGYLCDVELDIEQNGSRNKAVVKQRFVKGSDGWVATK